MRFHSCQILLQEVPGEISICFSITGCELRCKGCHSPYLWKKGSGEMLTKKIYLDILGKYTQLASCVLFMGGEWHKNELIDYLQDAKRHGYKTCLYTGEERVDNDILTELTWIKTGRWMPDIGGLDRESTNQRFIEVKSNKIMNHLFVKD